MSDIAILKKMINQSATVPLHDNDGKKQVILREPPPANYAVTIYGMPPADEVIIIKADAFRAPKEVFQGNHGECKRADFVIIADTDKQKVILCLEMKKGKGNNKEIIQQLKGALCFVKYCQEIGRSFWNQPNFLKDYVYRFVSIRDISIDKQPTQGRRNNGKHDTPDKMLTIRSSKHLNFDVLVK